MLRRRATALVLLAAVHALQPDANMAPTYANLAKRCANLHTKLQRQVWIGITGGPGAGKSTVAEAQPGMFDPAEEGIVPRTRYPATAIPPPVKGHGGALAVGWQRARQSP